MSALVSAAEYARIRGVSKTAVAKAIRAGRISTVAGSTGKRLIDPDRANVEWAAHTDIGRQRQGAPQEFEKTQPLARESAARQAAAEAATGAPAAPAAPASTATTATRPKSVAKAPTGTSTLLEEKTRSERLRVERQELDLAERRGELVSLACMRTAIAAKLISARELFESIPDRLAAPIAAQNNPDVVHRMLLDEILIAMTMLATVSSAGPH